jgi:5-formyltetrahydrofolate cyclo-ligase
LDSKSKARAALDAARALFPTEERKRESRAAVKALLETDLLKGKKTIALFAAREIEADPGGLEEPLVRDGSSIAYPRVDGRALIFHLARADELQPVPPWNIREPDPTMEVARAIDAYVVPGLGFTREGHRLGHGKGFYDRVLNGRGNAIAIGFAFSFQLVDHLPIEDHDVPVDWIVTGRDLIEVKNR